MEAKKEHEYPQHWHLAVLKCRDTGAVEVNTREIAALDGTSELLRFE